MHTNWEMSEQSCQRAQDPEQLGVQRLGSRAPRQCPGTELASLQIPGHYMDRERLAVSLFEVIVLSISGIDIHLTLSKNTIREKKLSVI